MLPLAVAFLLNAASSPSAADCTHLPSPPMRGAEANDNRTPAGTIRDGVLHVQLVAQEVAWRPDGASGCALTVRAFAEEGAAPRIPGPLIRVRSGADVEVSVRNALATPIWVRGLQDRSVGVSFDSTRIDAGATASFRFTAKARGAWYYSAGASPAAIPASDADGQLVGALVIDSIADDAPAPDDRVFVLTRWSPTGTLTDGGYQLNAMNGLSWPNTERLRYPQGDSIVWHVINPSNAVHEMHLHGFFFLTLGTGAQVATGAPVPPAARTALRVTTVVRPGSWVSIKWSPDRPGNWLFHCHLLSHMTGMQRLDRMPNAAPLPADHSPANHAEHDMGGLVMGVEVTPSVPQRAGGAASGATVRTFDLFANQSANRFGDRPGYGFVVQDGPRAPARDSTRMPGTPLILTRDEPVRIAVHNRLDIPLSVHWHGLELDSYFDGVGEFSGSGGQIAPMIQPEDSFVVRFTPPRAGTYMYHIHGETGEQLASGLYAPLLVLEPGQPYDPASDLVFVMADGGPGRGQPLFINGTAAPDTLNLVAGRSYRFRGIYITSDEVVQTSLRGAAGPVPGTRVGLDGAAITAAAPGLMDFPTGPGHTQDYSFTLAPGDYTLNVQRLSYTLSTAGARAGPITTLVIRAR